MVICIVHRNVLYKDCGRHSDWFTLRMLLIGHLTMARSEHSAATNV